MSLFWTAAVFGAAGYIGYESGGVVRDFLAYTKGQIDARRSMQQQQQSQNKNRTLNALPSFQFPSQINLVSSPLSHIKAR